MSAELDAFKALHRLDAIPLDAKYSPTKAQERYYTRELESFQEQKRKCPLGPSVGDVGKVPSAAALLQSKQPDDWLIDQFGARGSMVVLGGATGASKSTLIYGMAQAIS